MSTATDHNDFLKQADFDLLYPDARAVLDFWFSPKNEPYWFVKSDDFDQQIDDRFGELWEQACEGEMAHWRRGENTQPNALENSALENSALEDLAGRLAEIIVLDQFSRNLCRGQACSFSQDTMSLVLAQEAVEQTHFNKLPATWRQFMIMPFMHSESLVIHERYLPFFEQLNDDDTLNFEHKHRDIIERFGRYPHRNEVLGRESTVAENEFLAQPGSSF